MEKTKEFTCIMCPMGCTLTVRMDDNQNLHVTGNTCIRGEKYGKQEYLSPKRIVTTLMKTLDGDFVSVKTDNLIPKDKIDAILKASKNIILKKPLKIGDIAIKNVYDDVNLVVTKNLN
jgi:Uncharacterized protein with conserved CXXC pairs